ncbi:hypothetical protein ACFWOB_32435 [Streptomyces sp. NPDC058420]
MNTHGIKSVVSGADWALVTGDGLNRPDFDKYEVRCQVKSFKSDG